MIPGDAKRLKLRAWTSDPRCGFYVTFRDAWGRTQAGGRKYEWWLRFDEKERWKTFSYDIPREWTRPIAVTGVGSHNWTPFLLQQMPSQRTHLLPHPPGSGSMRRSHLHPRQI
ncbi:MAG: hypothetical protein ACYTKD_01400 [Planctomycetota bacterium]|jgi:hypothetical protein